MHSLRLLIVLLLFSCSQTTPRIPFGVFHLVYYQGKEEQQEYLSLFILAEDDDGIENLQTLHIYHTLEQLHWTLSAEDWRLVAEEGRTWIGTHALTAGATVPRGQYRAVLINKADRESEYLFNVDVPQQARFEFPAITIDTQTQTYRINAQYPAHFLLCYDSSGALLGTVTVATPEGTLAALNLPAGTQAVALWAEDRAYSTSAVTDTVLLHTR
ncbi:hypothetical protein PilKf_00006 [Pillotina sp. SPG140]|jgi:hypothetical protein